MKMTVKSYVPSMQGKRYYFATTQLGHKLLDNIAFQYDHRVAVCFMQQLLVKAALNKWGEDAKAAGLNEISQLHWRKFFFPKLYKQLTKEQWEIVLDSHMFIVKKVEWRIRAVWLQEGINSRITCQKRILVHPLLQPNLCC